MSSLRKGDIVTLRALVTRVAPYDDGQQIMVKLLPKGEELGWLLQRETGFTPAEQPIAVGDKVRHCTDDANTYEVMAMFDLGQIAIRVVGSKPVQMSHINRVERI